MLSLDVWPAGGEVVGGAVGARAVRKGGDGWGTGHDGCTRGVKKPHGRARAARGFWHSPCKVLHDGHADAARMPHYNAVFMNHRHAFV
ncbi:hypothetical protein THI4931_19910 [Pandoraea sputorum]|nr:hypothetical protein THI4931_19910 [Pandoraea sputorum]